MRNVLPFMAEIALRPLFAAGRIILGTAVLVKVNRSPGAATAWLTAHPRHG
jgi:hypothetical protein